MNSPLIDCETNIHVDICSFTLEGNTAFRAAEDRSILISRGYISRYINATDPPIL